MSQTKNATGLIVGRFFLGAIEAGLYPGALFILTCWYTKKEVGECTSIFEPELFCNEFAGKRFCIFYTSGCVSPALGGIMAGAIISRLDGARGIPGWRWLLLIEGVVTVFCGFCRKLVHAMRMYQPLIQSRQQSTWCFLIGRLTPRCCHLSR
jgi:MFS family permease